MQMALDRALGQIQQRGHFTHVLLFQIEERDHFGLWLRQP
jgi:hypothetical protein